MMIKALQHCALVVRDLERSRWFYGVVLEMEEVPRPANFTFRGAWFRQGPCEVHLIAADDTTAPAGQPDSGPARSSGLALHVAFEVDDLAAFQRQFAVHQVDIAAGPMPRGDGVEQAFVHDPDGYFVEVFQKTDAKAQAPQRGPVPG